MTDNDNIIKIKLFVDKKPRSNEMLAVVKQLNVYHEVIDITTKKGKKLDKEWCVHGGAPFLFFISKDDKRTYYSDNTDLTKTDLAKIIKGLEKKNNKRIYKQEETRNGDKEVSDE